MTNYRFSPIETQDVFEHVLEYVAEKVGDLSLTLCGQRLPVTIIKLFAHDDSEYQRLEEFVSQHGKKADVSSNNSFYVDVGSGLTVAETPIKLLGVRKPDATRPQVGCGDYEVENFSVFTASLQAEHPQYVLSVKNAHGLSMVELRHPDFDVLGYIIPMRVF